MKSDLVTIKRIMGQITGILTVRQRRKAAGVCVSMIMTSVLDLFSVSIIYPFLNLVLDPNAISERWYLKWMQVVMPDITVEKAILLIGLGIIVVFIMKNLMALYFSYLQHQFAAQFLAESSTLMLSSYMRREYEYFVNHNSTELLRGVDQDPNSVYTELLSIFQIIGEMLTVVGVGVYLFLISWELAIGTVILALLCFLGIVLGFKGRIKKAGRNNRQNQIIKNKYGLQAIHGIKEITVMDRRAHFVEMYSNAAQDFSKSLLTYNFLMACPDRLLEGICMSGFMGIVCFKIITGGNIDSLIPDLGVFVMGAFKILPSISKMSGRVNTIIFHQPGLQHCYKNIMEARCVDDEKYQVGVDDINKYRKIRFSNELVIHKISWKYANSERKVLDSLSMTINKGESVAFIGASGAGKTTLADIILGLFHPQEGSVEMDGIDITLMPHMWSKIVGYVPQAVYLVDDTIRANVAFGIEADKISDEKVWQALRQAQMEEYVKRLSQGLDTIVGERGIRFSGGQKQRIAIARALYNDPDILVLDEATSALDTDTETAVMESIEALHGHKTLIIVAHRLSTIRNCDRIYEIANGIANEVRLTDENTDCYTS